MAKTKRFEMKMCPAFKRVLRDEYCVPRGISMAAAITAAIEDMLTMAGVDWKEAVEGEMIVAGYMSEPDGK